MCCNLSFKNDAGDAAWVHVVKELTKDYANQDRIIVADNRFCSSAIMVWGADNHIGFVMTMSGNPVCLPEVMRSRTNDTWKYLKGGDRGRLMMLHSDKLNFTLVRDSSVLRLVDNCLDSSELTPRLARRYNKRTKVWRGVGKVCSQYNLC